MITAAQPRSEEPFLVAPITPPVLNEQADQKDVTLTWFIAVRVAFPLEAYRALTVQEIFELVKKHQPWKIYGGQEPKSRREPKGKREATAKRNIQYILTSSPKFKHDGAGHWCMTKKPLVRTNGMSQKLVKKSTLAMAHEENHAYNAWVDDFLAPRTV